MAAQGIASDEQNQFEQERRFWASHEKMCVPGDPPVRMPFHCATCPAEQPGACGCFPC